MAERSDFIYPRKLIILFAGLCTLFPSPAQENRNTRNYPEVEFEHIGEEQELVKVSECIYQDSRGFIWIGSGVDGLYRYDGYEFKHYQNQYDDSTSLSDNYVTELLFEDSSGDIWITFLTGECNRYNRATDNFTRFQNQPGNPNSVPLSSVSSVAEDHDGNIWLGYFADSREEPRGGLFRVERESGMITGYRNDPGNPGSLSSNCITKLFVDRSGNLWIGTCNRGVDRFVPSEAGEPEKFTHYPFVLGNPEDPVRTPIVKIVKDRSGTLWFGTNSEGMLRYIEEKDQFTRYWINPDRSAMDNYIINISFDKREDLWLATGGGLARYDPVLDTFKFYHHDPGDPFSISPGEVWVMEPDPEGFMWIGTKKAFYREGINRFDPVTGKSVLFQNDPDDPGSLSSNAANSAIIDRSGILWITTTEGGVNRFDPHKRKFHLLRPGPEYANRNPIQNVFSVIEDHEGILWIGTYELGLFRLDRSTGELSNFTFDPDNPHSINDNTVLTICEGPPGILWMGGLGGVNRLDTKTMEFRHYVHDPYDPNTIGANHIMYIIRDHSGFLWIGTLWGGLNRFDPETEQFRSFLHDPEDPESPEWTKGVLSVYEDSRGNIWSSSFEGLYQYIPGRDGRPDSLVHYTHDEHNPNSLSLNSTRVVFEDDSGFFWIGTGGGGLNRLDPKTGLFTVYTMEDGLPSNTVWGILPDERGRLWLSTIYGLSRFDPETEEFNNYNISDGLQAMGFSFNAYFLSPSGEMFFGGGNGINYFHPDEVTENPYIPPVVITDFRLFNQSVRAGEDSPLKRVVTEVKKIELRHDQNFLSFEFAALNYTNSSKNQYRYRMIGLDPDTVFSGTRRFAEYAGMKPGKYTFWVTGSNNDGIWNEEGVSLHIIIHPPWYKSRLAYGLYILVALLLITGFIQWRTYRLRKEKERLEKQVKERTHEIEEKDRHILEMDKMKTRFFANISHEFRTPVTLILNPVEEMISGKATKIKDHVKLGIIRRNGIRLLELVNQLLDLSKLDSGKLKLELLELDIIGTLRLICSSFFSLAEKRKINYHFHLPEGELVTFFDRGKLETIMNNLLSNAFKYTPDAGEVSCTVLSGDMSAEGGPEKIKITVGDSGPGISEKQADLIFDRFYQADEHRHMNGGGTGIGLSLTKELIHLIHGEIEVESKPGEGTRFVVTLPLGKDHLKESEYVIIQPEQDTGQKWSRVPLERETEEVVDTDRQPSEKPDKKADQILIVEDNTELRSYISDQFREEYLIEEARDGEEGIEKAIKNIPDLIISDIMMPRMDGIEFCRRIKTNDRTSHIPVVMLTARADTESRIEGLETGADDYVIKPFNIQELRTRVKNLITGRRDLRKQFTASLDVAPNEIPFNSYDVKFIRRIMEQVEQHLADFDFGVKELQAKTGMSQTQLYRKIYALTEMSPSRFIRHLRLKQAARLLEQDNENVTDVAFSVGFNNLSYFTKCFREQYGISPSVYLRQFQDKPEK